MAKNNRLKLLVSREEANRKIQARIEKGQKLHDRRINSVGELEIAIMDAQNWSDYNRDLEVSLFGNSVIESRYMRFDYSRLSDDQIDEYLVAGIYIPGLRDEVNEYQESMARSINSLKGICQRLELYEELLELYKELSDISRHGVINKEVAEFASGSIGDKVFIVHGRDNEAKVTVARFVETLGLTATILHEQPSRGLTIIEKLEKYARKAGFAIVVITPDDLGGLKDTADDEPNPRARQNVIFELGYFMGKLGREKVCPLFKGEVEKPSDIDGILYVPMDNNDGWKFNLAKEMKQAGLPVDMNKLV